MIKTLFQLLIIGLYACTSQAQTSNEQSKPLVIGNIDKIHSTLLNEDRVLNVYLPEGYQTTDSILYPVIYILDGSLNEDFLHLAGIVQYNSFSWVNRVPRSIVVGIANVDRRRDFTGKTSYEEDKKLAPTGGGSAKFISFIETELQPFIQKKYRTNHHRTIIGQSLAGLLATEILFTKPTLFDRYIIISPSLWWNNGALLKYTPDMLSATFSRSISIYIGVGKEGLTPAHDRVMEVDANLLSDKIKQGKSKAVKVFFDYLPLENHATVTHPAVFNAFRMLYSENEE
ncbi:MAG: alpha/beta hydrolase [Bacteroidetes bacterium]|nr:alpha/beta hydrolase [Bacteroidota bacterium]MBS1740539.1 alpha/beta hydrolase [Bacteroidota bacterium]